MTVKAKVKKAGDDEKLKELILILARESEGDPNFGAVKLNKELFYCDFLAYQHLGKSITGQEYIALERGPAPKYKTTIIHEMTKAGDLAIRPHEAFGDVQDRAFALREPKLDKFSKDELNLIHRVVHNCHDKSGKELSTMSHKFLGWRLAHEKEEIPYSVALGGRREPTLDEIKWGNELEAFAVECLKRHEAPAASNGPTSAAI
jgi:Protein of unknown function (DUF4065)